MCPQFLLNAPYHPSSLMAGPLKGLVTQRLNKLPQKKFPLGCAKAIGAQCFTELPWLRLHSLLLRTVPYARLHKPVFNASKLFQRVLKMPKSDLLPCFLPQTFLRWLKG